MTPLHTMQTRASGLRPHLVAAAAMAAACTIASAATTITLRPNASSDATTNGDAFVTPGPDNSLAANNYGGGGALAVSAAGLSAGAFDTFLRFDVSTATSAFDTAYSPGGWFIESVVLQLTTANPGNSIFNSSAAGDVSVHWISSDAWIEGTGNPNAPSATGVTWNDIASLTSAAESAGVLTLASVADGATADHPLLPGGGLLADIAGGGSVSLFLSAADPSVSAVFNSRSFGTESRRPALILTAAPVPEPALPGLLAFASAATLLRRRRSSPPRS